MTVNIQKLTQALVTKIASTTVACDLNLLSSAIKQLKAGQVWSVPSIPCLLSLSTTPSDNGKLFFVESDETLYYRNNQGMWVDLSGSLNQTKLSLWGAGTISTYTGVTTTGLNGYMTNIKGGGTNWCLVDSSHVACFALGIKTDGTLWTWGTNCCGVLGSNSGYSTGSRASPGTTAGGGTNWCSASAGNALYYPNAAAVKTDGTLWTWGAGYFGQLGNDSCGTFSRRQSPGTTVGGGTNWKNVAVGDRFMAALKTDGTVWTWGQSWRGKLGNNGTTVCRSSPATVNGGGTNWTQISAKSNEVGALKADGTLWSWGNCINVPTQIGAATDWCFVSTKGDASSGSIAAIKTDGTLWTCGINQCGELGNGTTTLGLSPTTVAGGGTTWCWVSLGCYSTSAIKTDGTLWTWGRNLEGELANGNSTNRSSPGTTVCSATNWWKVATGKPSMGLQRII